MLTYEIKNPQAARSYKTPPHITDNSNIIFDSKESIFKRHISKCFFAAGDEVVFKKPRRNKVFGTVTHIERDFDKITWMNGGRTPAILTVKLADKGSQKGTCVKAPIKSVIWQACLNKGNL